MRRFARHVARFALALWKDERTPRWARWLLGVAFLPTPLELDELLRLGVALGLWIRHRELLRDVWAATAEVGPAKVAP